MPKTASIRFLNLAVFFLKTTSMSVAGIFLLASCSLYPGIQTLYKPTEIPEDKVTVGYTSGERLVAVDLVNALRQIRGFEPGSKTIDLSYAETGFGAALYSALYDSGYGVRHVDNKKSESYLEHVVIAGPVVERGIHQFYVLSIGEVKLKRRYLISSDGVKPSSNLYVGGADPNIIVLHDEQFSVGGIN